VQAPRSAVHARSAVHRRRFVVGALVIALASFLTYARVWRFGFIYDDYWTVVGNVHLGRPLRELLAAALSGRTVEWNMPDATRPLMGLSLWLDRRAFGLAPAGYHLHSVALYAGVCVLAFGLAFGLLRSFVPALLAGLAFAVLPIHVEAVAAVNYREDLLAALGWFGAAAVAFWPGRGGFRGQAFVCGALWALALLAKESALVAPAFVAVLLLIRRPSVLGADVVPPLTLVAGAVAALWLNWRYGLSRLGEQIPTASYASWPDRLARTARFELIGLWKSLLPLGPQPERDKLGDAHWAWCLGLAVVVVLVVLLARRRSLRVPAAAVALALISPLCSSPLFAPVNELADRYWFMGSFGAALLLGWAVHRARSRAVLLAAIVLLGGLGVASSRASSVWASEVSLWTVAVQRAPASARAWVALSRVHRMAGQRELAERTLERALTLRPGYVSAQTAGVLNSLWFGDLEGARRQLASMPPEASVQGDSLRSARRCAAAADASAAAACAQRAVPVGLILGDTERLRAVSEQLLQMPIAAAAPPPAATRPAATAVRASVVDAGSDAGARR
jgi:protein O-mannosyl-transferase